MSNRLRYDEEAFIADAVGGKSPADLARTYGLRRAYVYRVLEGWTRPHIAERIAELRRPARREILRRIGRLQETALHTLETAMQNDPDQPVSNTAVSAAKDILSRTLKSEPSKTEGPGSIQPDLTRLSPETKQAVLRELGGPAGEDDA